MARVLLTLLILAGIVPDSVAGDVRGRILQRDPGARAEGPVIVFLRGNGMVTTRRGGPLVHTLEHAELDSGPAWRILRLNDRVRISGSSKRFFLFSGTSTSDLGPARPDAEIDRFATFGPRELYAPGGPAVHILVVENPYHVEADSDGTYILSGVTPGPYSLCAWRPGGPVGSVEVEIPFEGVVRADIRLWW